MCGDLCVPLLCKMEHSEKLPEHDPDFHRAIYQQCSFAFQRKVLESLTEIYITYAAARLTTKGTENIREVIQAAALRDEQKVQQVLQSYYAVLLDGMMTD